jgi:hypothetical protein
LRHNETAERALVEELTELVAELRVQLIGPIRQELLSGIKTKKQFSSLKKNNMGSVPDFSLDRTQDQLDEAILDGSLQEICHDQKE